MQGVRCSGWVKRAPFASSASSLPPTDVGFPSCGRPIFRRMQAGRVRLWKSSEQCGIALGPSGFSKWSLLIMVSSPRSTTKRSRTAGRDRRDDDESDMQPLGRTLPHSVEAEQHVIACCLIDGSDTIARCLESKLSENAFYDRANRLIYRKLCEIYQTKPPVDIAVLAEELRIARE